MGNSEEKKWLYVGCGLTHARQEFKDQITVLKTELGKDWHVLDFLGLVDGTSEDVYRRDIIKNIGSCDAFIAVADEPSIGLGYEIAIAVEQLHKPVLVTAHRNAKITRMLLGAAKVHQNMVFERYEDMVTDVPKLARSYFTTI